MSCSSRSISVIQGQKDQSKEVVTGVTDQQGERLGAFERWAHC